MQRIILKEPKDSNQTTIKLLDIVHETSICFVENNINLIHKETEKFTSKGETIVLLMILNNDKKVKRIKWPK